MKRLFLLLLLPLFAFGVVNPQFREHDPEYISGDGFRAYADHAYDELDSSLNPAAVRQSDVVFVQGEFLEKFFEEISPKISYSYILLTHNSDFHLPGKFKAHLDDPLLIGWFTTHYDGTKHPKMHPLPLGIANFTHPWGNTRTFKKVLDQHLERIHLAHMSFTIQNNLDERLPLFRLFSNASFVYRPIKKIFENYLVDMASSKFSISPLGVGLDTYRLWESLYVGTIPIVRTSSLDGMYEGLPILIIKDWKSVTEPFLEMQYEEFTRNPRSLEKLKLKYWTDQIDRCKREI